MTQDALKESYSKDFLQVVALNPIEVKCLACLSDVTYKGKASIWAHTSNNSHVKAKGEMMLRVEKNHLKLSNQHLQIQNQSLENKLDFRKEEVKNLLERIEELKQEKTLLLGRISGIDPNQFKILEQNVKSLCQAVQQGLNSNMDQKKLFDNSKLLHMIKDMQKKQKKVNQQESTNIQKQFLLHQQDLHASKELEAKKIQQISATIERIEKNFNDCSNQAKVLSAVQEMAQNFEISFEKKLNEIKPKRNLDDDETSDDDEGVFLEDLKFAHSSKPWVECSSMRRISRLLKIQSDYVYGFTSPQFSEQLSHLMEVKMEVDKHSKAQHKFKMKALGDLLAENPDKPKIWIIWKFYLKFISQYRKLGPVFKVLESHFKSLHLDKIIQDIRPLIKRAIDQGHLQLAFQRKAQATGKNIEDVMQDFNKENNFQEVDTDSEDQEADGETKDFKKMINKQIQSYFKRYRPWEYQELNQMWDSVFKHHAYSRCLFRWYLVTGSRHQDAFDITFKMFYDALNPDPMQRKQLEISHRKTIKPFQRVYMFPNKLVDDMRADLEYLQKKYGMKAKDYVFGSTLIKKRHHNWFNHNVKVIWGNPSTVNYVKPHQFHRFRSTATRIMRNNNDGTISTDIINQYFGWGADAKNCAKFYDSTLPQETSKVLANFMDKCNLNFTTCTQEIDKVKESKFDEFIRVYMFGDVAKSKTDPNSIRSVLAKKRTQKLQIKLYEIEMHKLPKNLRRVTFIEWQKQGGYEKFVKRVNEDNIQREREGKKPLKFDF